MIRYFSRLVFLVCILTTAIMISPASAENPAGGISVATGPLSPDLPSPPNVRIMAGEPAVSSAGGNGFPPEFRWAVPGEVGVHAFSIAIDDQDTVYATDPVNHSVWKFMPDGSRLVQWGSAGTGPGTFTAPLGVAVNSSRYVYITDLDRVHVFSPDGTFMKTWGSAGNSTGEFDSVLGITVNASGYVYTSETRTNRIQVFDPEGTFVTTWGTAGSLPREFSGPMSIAVNGSGFVFVADQFNNRIQVFDPSGIFLQSWNKPDGGTGDGNGEFSFPQCIAIDSSGYVFVGDSGNHRVQVFDQAGVYVRQFTSSIGLGIAANSSGYVYLTDYSYDRIQVFDPAGAAISSWGARGDGNGRFFHPWGVAVNASGYSFVTDSENHRIQVFSPSGDFAGQWGSQGSGAGEFLLPLGIAVNESGFVYVADSTNNRVQVFDPAGAYLTQWGSSGSSAGQLFDPRGIAVNSSGHVYITETGNARVQVFTSDGASLGYWGSQGSGAGEFDGPMGIAVNSSGFVFVADHANNRVQVFDPSGGHVMQVGSAGTGAGMLSFPIGVAVDNGGQVYVADNGNHRVQVFDRDGIYTGHWGSQGTNPGQFYSPAGIAVDSHGNVVVAELYNDRIQKFAFPESLPAGITISPGTPGIISSTIAAVPDGSTIILDPGTYYEHDIVITRNITIRANISAGGNAENTIIDGQNAGRIISDIGGPTINDNAYSLIIDNLTLQNGNAALSDTPGYGGAILISHDGGIVNITSSVFYNCSALYGGAIAVITPAPCCMHPRVTVISSSFTGCSASHGAALYAESESSNATIHFSRIYNNTGTAVYSNYGSVIDAINNWWGSNDDPSSQVQGATCTPWLKLNVIATPSSVTTSQTSTIKANFTFNSDDQYIDPALGHIPDSLPITYSATNGSIMPLTGIMAGGMNTTTFSPAGDGRVVVSGTVDGQTVTTGEYITTPRIQSISPASGSPAGGTLVTITGLRFTSVTGVSFGTSAAASYTVDSDTQISAVSPAHALGIVDITVTTDGGPSVLSASDQFTYTPPSSVFAINPGDSIQTAIDCSGPGYTIILNPGTYTGHDINVSKSISLRANTSAGGSAANTIIDGENAGRILDDSAGYPLTIDNLGFINGNATEYGGAILVSNDGGIVNISSSSFSNCSAVLGGGAIAAVSFMPCCSHPRVDIISSTFSNCSAPLGSVLYAGSQSSTATIHYSRIHENAGTAVYSDYGSIDAADNWWGTNNDPSAHVSGGVTVSPWLVLSINATPSSINSTETSAIRTRLTFNSDGFDTTGGDRFVPDGIPNTFAVTAGSGTVSPLADGTTGGAAETTFTPAAAGTSTVTATVDNQTVSTIITVTSGPVTPGPADMVGVFRPSSHTFILKNGSATTTINWGKSTDLPVSGDWNGDSLTDVGVFRSSTHTFILKNGSLTTNVSWGLKSDKPVTGDWNGDGMADVGVFRSSTHTFILKNGSLTTNVNWGKSTDLPVTGDWNGDGMADVGVFRPSTHTFILKNGSQTTSVSWGLKTDKPVTGDWNGDSLTDVGIFRPSTHTFILKNGTETTNVSWGQSSDLPVSGRWS